MAQQIAQLPVMTRQGGASKYDWDKYFDGNAWLLKQGEDFECDPKSLRTAAYTAARNRKISLQSRVFEQDGEQYFAVQKVSDEPRPSGGKRGRPKENGAETPEGKK